MSDLLIDRYRADRSKLLSRAPKRMPMRLGFPHRENPTEHNLTPPQNGPLLRRKNFSHIHFPQLRMVEKALMDSVNHLLQQQFGQNMIIKMENFKVFFK